MRKRNPDPKRSTRSMHSLGESILPFKTLYLVSFCSSGGPDLVTFLGRVRTAYMPASDICQEILGDSGRKARMSSLGEIEMPAFVGGRRGHGGAVRVELGGARSVEGAARSRGRTSGPAGAAEIRSRHGSPAQPQGELHSSGNPGSIRRSETRTRGRAPIIALGSQKRNVENVVHLRAKLKIPGP